MNIIVKHLVTLRFLIGATTLLGAVAGLRAAVPQAKAEGWIALPVISQPQRAAGLFGGEGTQVLQGIAIDRSGQVLLAGTDVGGMYRSTNGGERWESCNVGFKPRGICDVKIDPHNNAHFIAVGANSTDAGGWHGIYVSLDQGETWKSTLPRKYQGYRDFREQVAFDPASLQNGSSQIVYYSVADSGGGGLYKSLDGGQNWALIQADLGSCIVGVHPVKGWVYAAKAGDKNPGFYRSEDGGKTFQAVTSDAVRGLDVIPTRPDAVYINKADGVYVSLDGGLSFAKKSSAGLPKIDKPGLQNLKVSPANPDRMAINLSRGSTFNQARFYSHDGGQTWQPGKLDSTGSVIAGNGRPALFAWHPTDADVCFSFGGDFLTKSVDGARTFGWNNNGNTGIHAALGRFNFNAQNPDLLLMTSQDYNSVLTADGGQTWTVPKVSGQGWGGWNLAGYAFSGGPQGVMFAGNSRFYPPSQTSRTLRVSRDGGQSWTDTGHVGNASDTALGDPTDGDIAFWDNWRTVDRAQTWQPMPDCDGVFTASATGKRELYGVKGKTLVRSFDHGATWETLATVPSVDPIRDLAYDHLHQRLWIATHPFKKGALWRFDIGRDAAPLDVSASLPLDNNNRRFATSVAVDPVDPNVVYTGRSGNIYLSDAAVCRSLDGGQSWTVLTKRAAGAGLDGGREASGLRVHPVTRELWVAGQCFGNWKYPAPR